MESIPFKISAGNEYKGLVRYEPPVLVIEFEKWSWKEAAKTSRTVSIPIEEIDSADLHAGWFSTRLQIRFRRIEAAGDVPTGHPGTVTLAFARGDRERARRLASSLSLWISEKRLERLGTDPDD